MSSSALANNLSKLANTYAECRIRGRAYAYGAAFATAIALADWLIEGNPGNAGIVSLWLFLAYLWCHFRAHVCVIAGRNELRARLEAEAAPQAQPQAQAPAAHWL